MFTCFALLLHPMSHVLELVDRMCWHVVDLPHAMWHTSAYVSIRQGMWPVACVNASAHMPHAMSHVIDLFK